MDYKLHLPKGYVKPPLPGRDKWIAALMSGKYPQGQHHLCKDLCYCCLGVLSELQGRLDFDGRDNREYSLLSYDNPLFDILRSNGDFPLRVCVEIFNCTIICHALSTCNDFGLNFNQIADIIEAVWENAEWYE